MKSSIGFPFEHLTFKPYPVMDEVNAAIDTIPEGRSSMYHLCPPYAYLVVKMSKMSQMKLMTAYRYGFQHQNESVFVS